MTVNLETLVSLELEKGADQRVVAMAESIAALYPGASRAVLFYGSCLRESQLDGLMLDFYLIVADYRAAYGKSWLARANALLPPNVFPFAHQGLAAKYAVLSETDFARLCGYSADNVSVWARFAQPSRLLWVADDAARAAAIAAVSQAPITLMERSLPMLGEAPRDVLAVWTRGFALTYGAELRAERSGRSTSIVEADPARYQAFGEAALSEIAARRGAGANGHVAMVEQADLAAKAWRTLQRRGKRLTVLRLVKASFTFAGGIDYLAWKINRHAGTAILIKPWQRRWPLLGALTLLPRLLGSGAIR